MLSTRTPPAPPQVKPLSEALATLLGDGAEPVRNESAEAMGALMKIVGERAMNPVLEPLDDLRKAKVKEAFDKAVVKCKVGAAAPPPRAAAPSKSEPPKVCSFLVILIALLTQIHRKSWRRSQRRRTSRQVEKRQKCHPSSHL